MMLEREYRIMFDNEDNHWWYRNLHRKVLEAIEGHFSSKDIRIIDAACGTGGLIRFLKARGYQDVRGFDLSPEAVTLANGSGLEIFRGDLKEMGTYFPAEDADVVVCNDALYFLDENSLHTFNQAATTIMTPGGLLIANFPALKAFSGNHDTSVGITHRYNKAMLRKRFSDSGLKADQMTYWPFLLSPLIWLVRVFQRMKGGEPGDQPVRSDLKKEPVWINEGMNLICLAEHKLFSYTPFGSSLFVIFQKDKHKAA